MSHDLSRPISREQWYRIKIRVSEKAMAQNESQNLHFVQSTVA